MKPSHEATAVAVPLAFGWQFLRGFSIGAVPFAVLMMERRFDKVALVLFSCVPIVVFALSWRRATIGYAIGLWLIYQLYLAHVMGLIDPHRSDRRRSDRDVPIDDRALLEPEQPLPPHARRLDGFHVSDRRSTRAREDPHARLVERII